MRSLRCSVALVLLCSAAAFAQPPAAATPALDSREAAAALDRWIGQRVSAVRVAVEGRTDRDEELVAVLETQPGSALTLAAVRESIVHLMALARFQEVTVEAEPAIDGASLLYRLTPLHTVKGVEFRGDLGLPVGELRAVVVERFGSSPAASRAEEIAEMLEARLRDRGFLKAAVRSGTQPTDSNGRIRLAFEMTAGSPALVAKSTVDGGPAGSTATILRRLGVQSGARFDRLALEDAVTRYLDALRSEGYLEARLDPDITYSDDRERVDVVLRMSRGPLVSVAFRGDPLPDKLRQQVLALLTGGALDEDVLENQERTIEDDLRSRGFRDAKAPFRREPQGDGRLVVAFTVTRGPEYKVAAIEIDGNQLLTRSEVEPFLQVKPGEWFVESRIDVDAKTIESLYRAQGFRRATVAVATAPRTGDPVQLTSTFTIDEGPRTTIAAIQFQGASSLSVAELQKRIRSSVGGPFDQARVDADRDAVLDEYLSQGYQQAAVRVPAGLSADGTRFDVRFVIEEGPRSYLDHILVVGNARTGTGTIERALALPPGAPLTSAALREAQDRVSDLGLFRRVQLTPLERNSGNRRDLLVSVEEAPVNTIGYGGGLEGALRLKTNAATGIPEEKFDLAPRGFFEIARRNLWGKNRSVSLFMRGAIRTSDEFNTGPVPAVPSTLEDAGSGFREYRVLGNYREPRFMNLPVDVVVTGALDQAIRSTFDFNRKQVNVEGSHRFSSRLTLAARYLFGHTRRFNERIDPGELLPVDRLFPQVRISAFAASAVVSTRDDAFEPTRGVLTALDLTYAPRAIGSEVGFIKASWQGFVYRRVPWLTGAVVAAGARVGLATGFEQTVVDENGLRTVISQELPASERFFAGGDTTVRGWALDRLGSAAVLDVNGVSNGGNGLLIFNAELRFPFWRQKSLGGVVFVDAGNVFEKTGDIEVGQLRTGTGFGIRWRSPVGPLRMDFAWKLNPITFNNGQAENPFAWYVTIGQAF